MSNPTTDLLTRLRDDRGWKGCPSARELLDEAAHEIEELRLRALYLSEALRDKHA